MKKVFGFLILFMTCVQITFGQSSYLKQNSYINHLVDRLDIKSTVDNDYVFTSQKSYQKQDVVTMLWVLETESMKFTVKDRNQHAFIYKNCNIYADEGLRDNSKSLLKFFYHLKTDFYAKDAEDFSIRINPIINFGIGNAQNNEATMFQNKRGFSIEALLFKKIAIYSQFTDNQRRYPQYVNSFIKKFSAVPGIAAYKGFKDDFGLDFFDFEGYLSLPIYKKINFQFGHSKNFIGNGYRSLLLSNNAAPSLFGKLSGKIGKFSYTNIWSQLVGQYDIGLNNQNEKKKYQATHHLSINAFKNFNFGLFETIIFDRDNGFDANYLNPFLPYKAIEWYLGSPDNTIIGADFKYNFLKAYSVYGQLLFDEFKVDELFQNNNDWWANKFAYQLGFKAIDIAKISTLDAQLEYNLVRPYTYTYFTDNFDYNNDFLNYTHYNQAIAHPYGANFKELLAIIRFEPKKKWRIENITSFTRQGLSAENENFGDNIFLDNTTRNSETGELNYGHSMLQGNLQTTFLNSFRLSYTFWHNMFVDLNYVYRNSNLNDVNISTNYIMLSLRLNDVFEHLVY